MAEVKRLIRDKASSRAIPWLLVQLLSFSFTLTFILLALSVKKVVI